MDAARVIRPADARWPELIAHFPKLPVSAAGDGDHTSESAMTSCGYGVPRTDETGEMTGRDTLEKYWATRGEEKKEHSTGRSTMCGASTACQREWMKRRVSLLKLHRDSELRCSTRLPECRNKLWRVLLLLNLSRRDWNRADRVPVAPSLDK